jgi:hypothetical protein
MSKRDDFRQLLMLKKEHAQAHESERNVPPRNLDRKSQSPAVPRHFPHNAIGNR